MRKKNSLFNMIASMMSNILTIVIGVIAQAIFIKILGAEFLGINSVFQNIIAMLSVVELGFGSAIIYNLYKPIANNDIKTIQELMSFYKKCYHVIGIVILIIGLIFIPFIHFFVETSINENIILIFLIFLFDSVLSYFFSYKRSILYANQKNYIINIIHIGYVMLLNVFQCGELIIFKNYYIYLILKIVFRLLENLIISYKANELYPFLKNKKNLNLKPEIKKDISKRIKALFFHKIGAFIINGTDNIIISKFLGIITVGLYSNYYLIINSVHTVMYQIIQSTTASVGNLIATENVDKQLKIFKEIRFINFIISNFSSCAICCIMEKFITIWVGPEYILPFDVLIVLSINFYFTNMRTTFITFKDAAGICYEDRFVPILESILNIVASLCLVIFLGLKGVFIGTIISGLILWLYSYPKYIYVNKLGRTF